MIRLQVCVGNRRSTESRANSRATRTHSLLPSLCRIRKLYACEDKALDHDKIYRIVSTTYNAEPTVFSSSLFLPRGATSRLLGSGWPGKKNLQPRPLGLRLNREQPSFFKTPHIAAKPKFYRAGHLRETSSSCCTAPMPLASPTCSKRKSTQP